MGLKERILSMIAAAGLVLGSGSALANDKDAHDATVEDDPMTQVWEHIPIEEKVVEIGKYSLVLEEQNAVSAGIGYGSRIYSWQTLDTSAHQVIDDISIALGNAYFHTDAVGRVIVHPKDCYVKMNIIDAAVMKPYVARGAEDFLRVVYDKNNDGRLTDREMENGSAQFRSFLFHYALEQIPLDGKRHEVDLVTDFKEFARDYRRFRRSNPDPYFAVVR